MLRGRRPRRSFKSGVCSWVEVETWWCVGRVKVERLTRRSSRCVPAFRTEIFHPTTPVIDSYTRSVNRGYGLCVVREPLTVTPRR